MVAGPRLGVQPLGLVGGPDGVPLARRLELAGRLEQLEPELADRLEHPEARLAVGVLRAGAAGSSRPARRAPSSSSSPKSPSRSQTASAASRRQPPTKTREAREERLLLRQQQVVAPGDRPAQRLLARGEVLRAARQQRQPLVEAAQERRRRERPHPGRRQLDRQRQAVQPDADLRHGRRVHVAEGEVGGRAARPLDEQPHRLGVRTASATAGRRRSGTASGGTRCSCSPRRRSGIRLVTSTCRSGAATSSPATAGAAATPARSCRARAAAPCRAGTRSASRAASRPAARAGRASARSSGTTSSESRIGASATKKTPSAELVEHVGRDLEREARLAGAAGPGQRQQPHVLPLEQRAASRRARARAR